MVLGADWSDCSDSSSLSTNMQGFDKGGSAERVVTAHVPSDDAAASGGGGVVVVVVTLVVLDCIVEPAGGGCLWPGYLVQLCSTAHCPQKPVSDRHSPYGQSDLQAGQSMAPHLSQVRGGHSSWRLHMTHVKML